VRYADDWLLGCAGPKH
jgi:hypothetical protein